MSWQITGMGVVTPFADDPDSFFEALCAGRDACAPLRHFDAERFRMRHAYQIPELGGREPGLRATRWLCDAVAAALADAGLADDPSGVPVFVGTTLGEQRSVELWWHRGDRLRPADLTFEGALRRRFGTRTTYTFTNACGAALYALGLAADRVAAGEFDTVVVAGTDTISESAFGTMDRVQNDSPRALRPFDTGQAGMVMGEGAVAVVLRRGDAPARRVHARLLGVALNCDAHHPTAPATAGIERAVREAHRRCGVAPADIDLVMAHGSGTPLNDETEATVLTRIFADAGGGPLVTAVKSATGHTLGGSGLLSFVVAALATRRGLVPPVVGLTDPVPAAAGLRLVRGEPASAPVRRAQVDAFGFGGINAVAVLEAAA